MQQLARSVIALALLTLVFPGAATSTEEVTLEGSFVWAREEGDLGGDLKAVMTPDGENSWKIAFHFVWEEQPHIYTGTATGSLTDGVLEGKAINDSKERPRTYRFSGTFEDGTFTGTHALIRKDGTERDSGTLTLAHAP